MRLLCVFSLLCAGCGPEEKGGRRDPEPTTTTTVDSATSPTTDTVTIDTSDSGTDTATTPPLDCTAIPDAPLSMEVFDIETTEDFDFDASGNMVFAEWLGTSLIAVDYYGGFQLISGNVQDTRGISVLSDGRIIIAYIGVGMVGIIDPTTGSNTTLLSGLSSPNALEVTTNDVIIFSETGADQRVRQYDIATGESSPVATGFTYPNGLVINETHDVLYVSDSDAGIWKVAKNLDGTWAEKELLYDPPGFGSYDGLEIDACGNLYVLGFSSGQVVRFDPRVTPLDPVVIAELDNPDAFLWNAMHWGSGRGGWRRDTLYVTDRNKVFGLELGVPGKAQPVDAMP